MKKMPKTIWTISKKKSDEITDSLKIQLEEKKALASVTFQDQYAKLRFKAKVKAAKVKAGARLTADDIRRRFR